MRNFLGVALLLASAFTVHADIIVAQGGGNFQNDENVLFQEDVAGNPLIAVTNQSSNEVRFSSTHAAGLIAPSSGQSRIEGADGELYQDLTIDTVDSGLFFRTLIFNVNAGIDDTIALTVNWVCQVDADCSGAAPSPFFGTFAASQNGENFFRIQAINGQLIDSVTFQSNTASMFVQDTRQIRIGGFTDNLPQGGGEVPEPMTMSLLGAGLGAVALLKRRTRKA